MITVLKVLGGAWLAWVALNLLLMVLMAWVVEPKYPSFNGFYVAIPSWLPRLLNDDEVGAVIAHEHGHRDQLHVWENFILTCLFIGPSTARRQEQEMEADDYAAKNGHAMALATALRKLSNDEFDLRRADRLLQMH